MSSGLTNELHLAVEDNNILELQKLIAASKPESLNILAGKKELAALHVCAIRVRVFSRQPWSHLDQFLKPSLESCRMYKTITRGRSQSKRSR